MTTPALLLARTGLRIGEAVALHWDDLDFHVRFYFKLRKFNDLAELTMQNRARYRTIRNRSVTNKL
jgi:integrase